MGACSIQPALDILKDGDNNMFQIAIVHVGVGSVDLLW